MSKVKEQLIRRIKEIEAEQEKRLNSDRLRLYAPHAKQLAFHRCPKRNRWVFGGNRTGKTECGAAECAYIALGEHPYRENRDGVFGWVVSPSTQVQRDVAQKKVLSYIRPDRILDVVMISGRKDAPEYGVIDQLKVKNSFGGVSVIGFKSCDQGREKFQGSSLDFVWFDEEPPEDIYAECRMRVLDRRGSIFGTMTPLKGKTFLYDEIYLNAGDSPDVWCEFMTWADNPYLSAEETAALGGTMSEEELQMRRDGRFYDGRGQVYPEFDESVHVIEPFTVPPEWQDVVAIDPGFSNPLAALWFACDGDGRVFAVAEHYEAGKDVGYHARRIREISEKLGWKKDGKGRIAAIIDSAANQRTLAASRNVTELFAEEGILADPNVDKEVFGGIARVKSYLKPASGEPKLYIFRNCANLIKELKSYEWGENDRPRKVMDHCCDCLRYYIAGRPRARKPRAAKSDVARDKERRMRALVVGDRGGFG